MEPCSLAFCVSHVAGRVHVLEAAEQTMGFNVVLADWQAFSCFQGARQVPDGFWLQRAVHTGWGSSVALSCWVRSVAEARDENRGTRQGCGTACVPPLKSNQKRGECFLVLRLVSWCPGGAGAPGLWSSVLLLSVCPVSSCAPGLVASSGHRPKDRVFPDRPTTCRVGSPWWPGMRGDDPRTDLLAGTPFSTYIITAVLVVAPVYLLWSFFPHVCSTHRRGLVEEPPRVEGALRGGCSFFFSSSPTVIMATVTTTTYAVVLRLWLRGILLLHYLFPLFLSSSSLLLCFSVVCACGRCLSRVGSCDEVCRIDWSSYDTKRCPSVPPL